MAGPISIRLDDRTRETLEGEAERLNIGLSALIRRLSADAAREVRRRRIRESSEAVARHVAESPEAREFFEFWGTPRTEL
jgi:hypothetical protein